MGLRSGCIAFICAALLTSTTTAAQAQTRNTYHADTRFTPPERVLLARAAVSVALQTRGLVGLELVYDYHAAGDGIASFLPLADQQWILVRGKGEHTPWVAEWDLAIGGKVLGLCMRDMHQIYLFLDRVHTDAGVHVAMHETLHSVGVDHVDGGAIMGAFVGPLAPTCVNAPDAIEICRVLDCAPSSLPFCL